MLRVLYSCIVNQHDVRLAALAGFVCVFACFTGASLLSLAREADGRRRLELISGAAAVFATGVWATHFVAELAYRPGMPVAYDFALTALSLMIALLMAWIGMAVAVEFERPATGGLVIGAAIAAMHYTGMAALRAPADIHWNFTYVAVSVAVGMIGATAAMRVLWLEPGWRYRISGAMLLLIAIVGLHFTGMAAITLVPNPLIALPEKAIAPELLAILVAAATIGIVLLGISVSIFAEHSARRATVEAERLRLSEEQLHAALSELRRHDTILDAVANSAAKLVTGESLDIAVPKALEIVARAVGVDRALMAEAAPAAIDRAGLTLRYAWQAPGLSITVEAAPFATMLSNSPDLRAWLMPLRDGGVATALLRNSAGDVRGFLEGLGIQSTLVIPIMVEGRHWGQIGFDDCHKERVWSIAEIDLLKTLAELIGASIARRRFVDALADADRIVQNSPTILYRVGADYSRPLTYVSANVGRVFGHEVARFLEIPDFYGLSLIHI